MIATTNAMESLNARFRRSVKARGHFPNEQAALKQLHRSLEQARSGVLGTAQSGCDELRG